MKKKVKMKMTTSLVSSQSQRRRRRKMPIQRSQLQSKHGDQVSKTNSKKQKVKVVKRH